MKLRLTRRDGREEFGDVFFGLRGLELVGLGENEIEGPAGFRQPGKELEVDLLGLKARIDQNKNAPQILALGHVVGDELLEKRSTALRHFGEAVAGEVNETAGAVDAEKIDELGATGSLGNSGEFFVSREKIQKGGFADI
jgi:hypothetical protein